MAIIFKEMRKKLVKMAKNMNQRTNREFQEAASQKSSRNFRGSERVSG